MRYLLALLACTCFAVDAFAQPTEVGEGFLRNGRVTDLVTPLPPDFFDFEFFVHNISIPAGPGQQNEEGFSPFPPLIIDWELPFFDDLGIVNLRAPTGWFVVIETIGVPNPLTGWGGVAGWQDPNEPLFAGPNSPFTLGTKVIHWYTDDLLFGIPIGQTLGGFGFDAPFGPTPAPYQSSWYLLPIQVGDPAFPSTGLPASPTVTGNAVPEPGLLALCAVGIVLVRRRRR